MIYERKPKLFTFQLADAEGRRPNERHHVAVNLPLKCLVASNSRLLRRRRFDLHASPDDVQLRLS